MPGHRGGQAEDEAPDGVEEGFGAVAVPEQVECLPAGGGPGRVAAAEPDAGHVEVVGAEAVVEGEPGQEAEKQ